ncbi:MAG: DUF992 domain-containing protein [Methyloceanibacter sp.]|jgi:hypothetical protein
MQFGRLSFAAVLGGMTIAGVWHAADAQTPPSGQLKCHVEGGMSFIVGSSRQVDCIYTPSGGGQREAYAGSINKIGIDIGWEKGGTLLWGVLSPALTQGPGALSGNYIGATAEVAAGVGAGANALVGTNKVVLNPISVTGDVGINLAAGIADLDLNYVGQR